MQYGTVLFVQQYFSAFVATSSEFITWIRKTIISSMMRNCRRCPSFWRLARLRLSHSRLFCRLLRTLRSMRRVRMLKASAGAENRAGSEGRQRGNARSSEGRGDSTATAKNSGLWSRAATAELYHTQTHTPAKISSSHYLSLPLIRKQQLQKQQKQQQQQK